jgi:IclR family transcriptional regulator, pca regulon regulatory protein
VAQPNADMASSIPGPANARGRKRLNRNATANDRRLDDEEFIKSLAKGLAVIESFGPDYPEMNLSTVARRNGLTPGSTRRVLNTLAKLGYVWMEDQRYRLSARALRLGYAYLSSQPIVNLIQPRLSALSEALNESCALSILDGTDAVCIARATARRLARDYMSVGARWPAHATSAGKVLLGAFSKDDIHALYEGHSRLPVVTPFTITDLQVLLQQIDKARRDGWCYINQETALGIASLSVPIRVGGEIRYSLSVSAQVNFAVTTIMERYLPDLLGTATLISGMLATKT